MYRLGLTIFDFDIFSSEENEDADLERIISVESMFARQMVLKLFSDDAKRCKASSCQENNTIPTKAITLFCIVLLYHQ